LDFAFKNERKGFRGLAEDFTPVRWGARRYLIPTDDIAGFCNEVNAGSEPRNDVHGRYPLRLGDEKLAVEGAPILPNEFAGYLLKKPIEGQIVEVRKSTTRPSVVDFKFKDTKVILNVGTNNGVKVGMRFFVIAGTERVESVDITTITGDRAEGVMTQIGEDEPGPDVGWKVSTRPRWRK
jgi:hypothetical protein